MEKKEIRFISSMATKALLAELATQFPADPLQAVAIESVGGVDAARRVQAGEPFDAVVLAADAIDKLRAAGHVLADSHFDLVRSQVAVAVRAGSPQPPIDSPAALQRAVLAARSVGYSTGPSGTQLLALFDRWGIRQQIEARLVLAPPGVPVGSLVAQGQAELGFQQLSELMALPGISVLGILPEPLQIVTTFSAAVVAGSTQPDAVRALLAHWASPAAAQAKRRHGMDPA